jgi:hypothetical protein
MGRACIYLGALLVALALLPAGCRDDELLRDMAALDRVYVAALAGTGGAGDTGSAVMAVKEFKMQWFTFKVKHSSYGSGDPEWADALQRIEDMTMRADSFVNIGNLKGAHSALEGIGIAFMELRRDYGIDYFMDHLTEFHSAMEPIVETAGDGVLTAAEIDLMEKTLPVAVRLWEKVRTAKFDGRLFGFDKLKRRRMREHFDEVGAALGTLDSALGRNDREAIVQAARALKPPFARTFSLFGRHAATF